MTSCTINIHHLFIIYLKWKFSKLVPFNSQLYAHIVLTANYTRKTNLILFNLAVCWIYLFCFRSDDTRFSAGRRRPPLFSTKFTYYYRNDQTVGADIYNMYDDDTRVENIKSIFTHCSSTVRYGMVVWDIQNRCRRGDPFWT